MKVVLTKSVPTLGRAGEVKNVSDGYARNFLLPKNWAVQATDKNIEKFKKIAENKIKVKKGGVFNPAKLMNKLNSVVVNFHEKMNDSGTFFVGITKDKVAVALKEKGCDIKDKQVLLSEPIKKPGTYKITVKVDPANKVKITLIASAK